MRITWFISTTAVKRREQNIEAGLSKCPRKRQAKHPTLFAIRDVEFLKFNSHVA